MNDGNGVNAFWEALAPKIRQLIREETRSAVRRKKMNVFYVNTRTRKITVYEAANPDVKIIIPYKSSAGIEDLTTGQSVMVEWIYDDLSTAMAVTPGDGDVIEAVPVSRTVNGHDLSGDITLSASDVGAVPTSRTVNGKALSSNISLTASDVGAVPTSRTVNGKALSYNISLSSSDVGARADTWMPTASDVGAIPTSDDTVARIGASGTWATPTTTLPTTPTGAGATMNVTFSIPGGAVLLGVSVSAGNAAIAIVSNRIVSNTTAQIRAYSLATGTTFTWENVVAKPIYKI